MIKCFTSDRIDHEGKKWTFKNVPMVMKPLQKPYPPLWYGLRGDNGGMLAARHGMNAVASGTNEGVARHLARFRAAWEPEAESRLAYRSPVTNPFIGGMRNIVIAETDAEADRIARDAYHKWYDNLNWLWVQSGTPAPTGFSADYEAARRTGSLIVGSPDAVRAEIASQAEICGFEDLVLVMAFGSMRHEQAMTSLDLFRRKVMPAFQVQRETV